MKNYDWKYIFKKVLIFFIIFVILSFTRSCNVKALTITNSGDSLKNIAKIGSQYVGANYYYEKAPNGWDESPLNLTFWVPAESISAQQGTRDVNFSVDYCINGSATQFEIWSKYKNSVDYTYYLDKHIYVANGDWAYTSCYRSYITINMNYLLDTNNPVQDTLIYSNNSNVFAIYSNDNFNKLIRYIDLVYYNSKDYDTAIQNAKQVGQQNTIINQNTQINNSINDVNSSINDDNVSGAESQVNDLLNNSSFQDSSGIQSIITAPLNFIQGLTNTCSPISLTIPFINTNVTIPCMKQELTARVPTIVPILSTIINGFIIYRILLDIVGIVKSAREPDEDRIEVLDL